MIYRLVHELAADGIDVAVACRVLRVPRAASYEWRGRAPSARAVTGEQLTVTITEVHQASRGTYGAPRVHAECGRHPAGRVADSSRTETPPEGSPEPPTEMNPQVTGVETRGIEPLTPALQNRPRGGLAQWAVTEKPT